MAPTLVDEPPPPETGTEEVMAEVSPLAPVTVTVLGAKRGAWTSETLPVEQRKEALTRCSMSDRRRSK